VFRTASKLIVCVVLLALALPAFAQASSFDVIKDCQDNSKLDRKHSRADLQNAQNNLPTDVDEYGDCRELIAAALNSDVGKNKHGGGGGSDSGASGATASAAKKHQSEAAARAQDAAALDRQRGHKPEVTVGGKSVTPGDDGLFKVASANNGLPLPLLLGIIAAALLAVMGGLAVLKRRAPAFANRIPLLSRISLPRVRLPRPDRR
jgi:hypothetical protein